jgi:hypothetical protein
MPSCVQPVGVSEKKSFEWILYQYYTIDCPNLDLKSIFKFAKRLHHAIVAWSIVSQKL